MRLRHSRICKLWANLLVGLFVVGVVTPGVVYCHETDGSVNVEYGPWCVGPPASEPLLASPASPGLCGAACSSCLDIPIFNVAQGPSHSSHLANLIKGTAGIVVLGSPGDSEPQERIAVALPVDHNSLAQASVQSIVLLI